MQKMEKGLLAQLLRLGLVCVQEIITGKKEEIRSYAPKSESGEKLEKKGEKERKYLSIFGLVEITRMRYWSKREGSHYELDERLELPRKLWSYNLQEWIGENASEKNYKESVKAYNNVLSLGLRGMSSQRNAMDLGEKCDKFYEEKEIEESEYETHYSGSFDGKGVPKIKDIEKREGNPKKRLGKGEKSGKKQEATVSVTSSFKPKKRSRSSIVRSLMGMESKQKNQKKEERENDNTWHKNIHRRAFLANQSKAIEYGLDWIRVRMKSPDCRFVVPIDAGAGLETKVLAYVKKHKLETQFDGIIMDIIHVSEYVWDVATALFGEKSTLRYSWVKKMLEDLLDSKTKLVIQDLEKIRDKGTLTKTQRKQVIKTITYFSNNGHKMDYKFFIEKGYPVSSALVESACGHLVKERMEGTGMRWSSSGAQNILDLRAVKQNGDLTTFMNFTVEQQHQKISNNAA